MPALVRLSPDGRELGQLLQALATVGDGRRLLGIAGAPGAGKSTLARAVAELHRTRGGVPAVVPMDGFHLADVVLDERGIRDRKGAPESFDPWGYAALLGRLRRRPDHTVFAPGFERGLEQPLAGAVPVAEAVDLVVTEGNYLLLDDPPWRAARGQLDAVWFVEADDDVRRERLVARHVTFGKSADEARGWVERVDQPNAVAVRSTRDRADLVLEVTAWEAVP